MFKKKKCKQPTCQQKVATKNNQYCQQHICHHQSCEAEKLSKYRYCGEHVNLHITTKCGCTINSDPLGTYNHSQCPVHKCRSKRCIGKVHDNSVYCYLCRCDDCVGLAILRLRNENEDSYCLSCFMKHYQLQHILPSSTLPKSINKKRPTKKKLKKQPIFTNPPLITFYSEDLLQ